MQSSLLLLVVVLISAVHEAASFSCTSLTLSRRAINKATPLNYGNIHRLHMSSDDTDAVSNDKINGRKNRVVIGYKAMTATYLTAGLLAAKASGLSINLARTLGGYIALPAGLSYILISAAANDRLGSDTYKRLNLAMLEYGVLGAAVVVLAKGRNKVLALAFLLSIINCVKGYAYGVLGLDKKKEGASLFGDLVQGTKETIKGFLTMPSNAIAVGYFTVTSMIASLKIQKLIEVVKYIKASGLVEGLAIPLARFNRLALITLCLYTLKDAADRNRLGGTTFIELNYLCALSLVVQTAFHTDGLSTAIGAASAGFALFCGFNGINEYMKKK